MSAPSSPPSSSQSVSDHKRPIQRKEKDWKIAKKEDSKQKEELRLRPPLPQPRSDPARWNSASTPESLPAVRIPTNRFFLRVSHFVHQPPPFIPDISLQVPEGIYMIRNALNGWVIETDEVNERAVRVHLAPSREGKAQTQLWAIQKSPRKGFSYDIRSVATGLVLDVYLNSDRQGSKVVAHGYHGAGNQSWAFWGTRQNAT